MNVGCRAWTKIFNARLLFLSLLHQEDIWRSHRANKLLLMQLNWILLEAHHFMQCIPISLKVTHALHVLKVSPLLKKQHLKSKFQVFSQTFQLLTCFFLEYLIIAQCSPVIMALESVACYKYYYFNFSHWEQDSNPCSETQQKFKPETLTAEQPQPWSPGQEWHTYCLIKERPAFFPLLYLYWGSLKTIKYKSKKGAGALIK